MSTKSEGSERDATTPMHLPSWIVLVLTAAVPVLFATGFSAFETVKDALLVGGTGLALVVWAVNLLRTERVGLVAGRVTVLAVGVGLYVLLAVSWAPIPLAGAVDALHIAALMALVTIISAPTGRPIRFEDLAMAVGAGAAITGVFGLADWAGLGVFTRIWDPPGATGAFDSMEFASAYYGVALPIIMGAILRLDGWKRIASGGFLLVAGFHFGMMASWSFVGLLAVACLIAAVLILGFEGTETITVLAPGAVLVGLVVLLKLLAFQVAGFPSEPSDATAAPYLMADSSVTERQIQDQQPRNPVFSIGRTESVRSMEMRGYLVEGAFDLFQDRPSIGLGPSGWWHNQTKYPNAEHPAVQGVFANYPAYRTPHNGWARFLVEYGAIGFALLALWLLGVAAIAIGAFGRTGADPRAISEQWGLVGSAVAGVGFITLTPLLMLASASVVWAVALGMLTRRSAAINEYTGSSQRWEWQPASAGAGSKLVVVGLPLLLGLAMVVVTTLNTASALHRGYGDHLMLRTYFERAIEQYEKADAWYPAHGDVPYNIAVATSRLGGMGKAADHIDRAVQMRPFDARVLDLKARLLLGQGNVSEAIRVAKKAVNAAPNYIDARKTLASAFQSMGQFEPSATQLVKIIERDPPESALQTLHFQLAELYTNGLGDFAEARDHYEAALELAGTKAEKERINNKMQALEKRIERKKKGLPPGGPPGGHGHGHDHGAPPSPPGLENLPKDLQDPQKLKKLREKMKESEGK